MKLCWLTRRIIAESVDTSDPLPRWVDRHLSACGECHQFRQTHLKLARELRDVAQSEVIEFPPLLHNRIIAALPDRSREARRPVEVAFSFRQFWAPALGLAAVLALVVWKSERPRPLPQAHVSTEVESSASSLVDPSSPAPMLVALSERLDEPLESEMKAVVQDARFAFQSLTENFLPAK